MVSYVDDKNISLAASGLFMWENFVWSFSSWPNWIQGEDNGRGPFRDNGRHRFTTDIQIELKRGGGSRDSVDFKSLEVKI